MQGGEVTCFGQPVAYNFKMVDRNEGALTVSLKIYDQTNEDNFSARKHN